MLLRLHLLALVCSLAACTGEVGSDGATLGDPTLDDLRHCGRNPRHPCPPDAMTSPDAALPPDAAPTPDAAPPPPPDAAPPDAAPMPDAAPTTHTLTVNRAGSGAGSVTSSPTGINCGTACSASFLSGTSVTLTATASSGSIFAGWSGACSGTGSCNVALNANTSVTATFNLDCIQAAALPTPSDGHHNAGADCLGCHAGLGSSLAWTVAGTLYTNTTGSAPIAQATIQVVDANGQTVNIATATNGNFWTLTPVRFPLRVKASKCPSTATMSSTASAGSCNGCHNAGFRIHLP
jgi:List-Bact-rpt repeat protein